MQAAGLVSGENIYGNFPVCADIFRFISIYYRIRIFELYIFPQISQTCPFQNGYSITQIKYDIKIYVECNPQKRH